MSSLTTDGKLLAMQFEVWLFNPDIRKVQEVVMKMGDPGASYVGMQIL